MAERILQYHLPDKAISSAGIGALEGKGIDENAQDLLRQSGYTADNHCARQVSVKMLNDADLVLVMEKRHQAALMSRYPSSSGKVMLLGSWLDQEIHDPYCKSYEVFKHVFERVERCCFSWVPMLNDR